MFKEFVSVCPARIRVVGDLIWIVLLAAVLGACSPAGSPNESGSPPEAQAGAEVQPDHGPTPTSQPDRPDAWTSSRADLLNTGQSGSLTDAEKGKIRWVWQAETEITQTPVSEGGVIYVGDWSPSFHAIDLATGDLIWRNKPRLVKNDNRKLPDEGTSLIDQAVPSDLDDRYEYSAPVIFEDLVITCTRYGVLTAFQRADGLVAWERDLETEIYSSLRVARGRLLVGDAKGQFRGFDARTGEPLFTYETADMIGSTCAVLSDGVAVFPAHDRRLHLVDIETGKARRIVDMTYRSTSTPLIAFGCAFLLHSGRHVVALDLVDGHERWRQPATEVTSNGLARAGDLIVVHIGGNLRAFDGVTGAQAWSVPLNGAGAVAPAVGPRLVYVSDAAGWVHAVDPVRGQEVWKDHFAESACAAPILVGGLLICAGLKGKLVAYE